MPRSPGVPINGAAVRAIRERTGLSVTALAIEATISTAFLSNIEAGRKPRVSPEVRERIRARLDVPLDAITYIGASAEVGAA